MLPKSDQFVVAQASLASRNAPRLKDRVLHTEMAMVKRSDPMCTLRIKKRETHDTQKPLEPESAQGNLEQFEFSRSFRLFELSCVLEPLLLLARGVR
jgi:hypothetical protein